MTLNTLRERGFDLSVHIPFTKHFRVGCSQCCAVCVNGTPCHEWGCANQTFHCQGCEATVPFNVKYCADCNS